MPGRPPPRTCPSPIRGTSTSMQPPHVACLPYRAVRAATSSDELQELAIREGFERQQEQADPVDPANTRAGKRPLGFVPFGCTLIRVGAVMEPHPHDGPRYLVPVG